MVEPIESLFPGLQKSGFRVSSLATRASNCIAWAAGDTTHWWWPDPDPENDAIFWPGGIALEQTLDAFLAALATLGYARCSGEELESGVEKIALFAKASLPTHAARQLPTGVWTSKLGSGEDIEHDLHAVSGDLYGTVVLLLSRPFDAP